MNFKQRIGNITTTIYPVRTIRRGIGSDLKINTKNSSGDYQSGTNEYPVQQVLARYLKTDDVFYDIGANIGFFSLIAARLVGPSGHVYAFEPVPDSILILKENILLNYFKNITVFHS
jgi:predicted methyltransferase